MSLGAWGEKAPGYIKCQHCRGTGEIEMKAATVGDMILEERRRLDACTYK